MTRPTKLACLSVLALIIAGLVAPAPAQVRTENGEVYVTGITQPSKRSKPSFYGAGVIEKVAVKEGDVVKAGQLLMAQDQEIEALELERLQAEADSNSRVEFAQADLDVKIAVEKRKTSGEAGVFSDAEQEEAKLDRISREKSLEIAKQEQAQNKIKARQQAAKVKRMNLLSEIDGIVEKIDVWEGEMVAGDPSKPAIVVVKNDPMYIEIRDLNTRQVSLLKPGEALEVKYPGAANWQAAKIAHISPVADASSDTQLVRLEMPNPDNRATGLPIQVKLPSKLVELMPGEKAALNR
jgi:multidrug efflux pump subunit AcrA (membrane-fusion protein)